MCVYFCFIYVSMHVCIFLCLSIYICIYIYICICKYICIFSYVHIMKIYVNAISDTSRQKGASKIRRIKLTMCNHKRVHTDVGTPRTERDATP